MERRSFLALPWFGRRKEIKACGARFRVRVALEAEAVGGAT